MTDYDTSNKEKTLIREIRTNLKQTRLCLEKLRGSMDDKTIQVRLALMIDQMDNNLLHMDFCRERLAAEALNRTIE